MEFVNFKYRVGVGARCAGLQKDSTAVRFIFFSDLLSPLSICFSINRCREILFIRSPLFTRFLSNNSPPFFFFYTPQPFAKIARRGHGFYIRTHASEIPRVPSRASAAMDDEAIQVIRSQVRGVGTNLSAVIEESKSVNRENAALRHRLRELETQLRGRRRVHRGTQIEPIDSEQHATPVTPRANKLSNALSTPPRESHKTPPPPPDAAHVGRNARMRTAAVDPPGLAAIAGLDGKTSATHSCMASHLSFFQLPASLQQLALAANASACNHCSYLPCVVQRMPIPISDSGIGLGFFLTTHSAAWLF